MILEVVYNMPSSPLRPVCTALVLSAEFGFLCSACGAFSRQPYRQCQVWLRFVLSDNQNSWVPALCETCAAPVSRNKALGVDVDLLTSG